MSAPLDVLALIEDEIGAGEILAAVQELVAQARNIDAILHHPDRSVTFLDADRLRAALENFGGAA